MCRLCGGLFRPFSTLDKNPRLRHYITPLITDALVIDILSGHCRPESLYGIRSDSNITTFPKSVVLAASGNKSRQGYRRLSPGALLLEAVGIGRRIGGRGRLKVEIND